MGVRQSSSPVSHLILEGRRTDERFEPPGEVALIGKAGVQRRLDDGDSVRQHAFGQMDPLLEAVCVGRHAKGSPKPTQKVLRTQPDVGGQLLQGDVVCDVFQKVCLRQLHQIGGAIV